MRFKKQNDLLWNGNANRALCGMSSEGLNTATIGQALHSFLYMYHNNFTSNIVNHLPGPNARIVRITLWNFINVHVYSTLYF